MKNVRLPRDLMEKRYAVPLLVFLSYVALHLLFQRHQLMAYDMYNYTSFAEHYARNWFYTVIPGQAHGLQIVSYPPLLFQVMALFLMVPFIGQKWLALVLMSAGVTALSYSIYLFLQDITGTNSNRNLMIILLAFSPGLMKFVLVHGQLPFVIGMTLAFLASRYYYRCLERNEGPYFMVFLVLTAFVHHFSFLMLAIILAVITLLNFKDFVARIDYILPQIMISAIMSLLGLYPMIWETFFGIKQGVIQHGSRHPLTNIKIFNLFVSSTYGITALGIFLVFQKKRRFHELNILALVFLTLGLGLLTPTPEVLFGKMSTFLVYDRFSLIASLLFTGLIGYYLSDIDRELFSYDLTKILVSIFLALSLATVFWANNLHLDSYTGYGDFEEDRTQTAINYLNQNASGDYLYTTIGHGPPTGEIRINTDVPTLETGYFQGRKHGLLPKWGKFDRLSRKKFSKVRQESDNLSLKYVLTFNERLDSLFRGVDNWEKKELQEDVTIWVNTDAPRYEPDLGKRRFLFGIVPMINLFLAVLVLASRDFREKIEELIQVLREKIKSFPESGNYRILWVLIFPIIAAAPSFLTSGYPSGIDTPAHIFKPQLMQQMVAEYGRKFYWTDAWYNGYPFMAMYSPLSTNLMYYLDILIEDITLVYNILRLLAISGVSAMFYILSGNITRNKNLRIAASALSVFSYSLYSNLYTVGRFGSALALPFYLFLIHLAFRDDVFQKQVSRGHIYLGVSAAALFLIHSMMAYLFLYTAMIFCWIYRERIKNIGLKPLLLTILIPSVISSPYIARLLQHLSITTPFWYILPVDFDVFNHLKRSFKIIPPTFVGWLTAALFSVGIIKHWRNRDRFFRFSALNFVFFYVTFWARNFRVALFMPLSGQFDLSRFEILYVIFALFLAVYGLRYLFREYLKDSESDKKTVLLASMIALVFIGNAPMLMQSANWQPEFKEEMNQVELDSDYRGIGVDIRQWHSYILWQMNISDTYGWFNQADPNPYFRQSLQRSGGRWHGWNFVQDISNPEYRENLMELSNTKYVISAEGKWMKKTRKYQVKGGDPLNHPLNQEFITSLKQDQDFTLIHKSEHLQILSFEKSMSYCEGVNPVWITEDYRSRADKMLLKPNMLPEIPVKGSAEGKPEGAAEGVKCEKVNPYTRNITVQKPGWVLVKESYYPLWERENGRKIYDGFGFMVLHVNKSASLRYRPRNMGTLQKSDFTKLLGG